MSAKVILFDFDGTIADTYEAVADITNQLSTEFGYKALDTEEQSLLKNLSSREIFKLSEISIFKLPFLVRRVRSELSKEIGELLPIEGLTQILLELQNNKDLTHMKLSLNLLAKSKRRERSKLQLLFSNS